MDGSLREMPDARDHLPDAGWRLVQGYGLRPDLLAMTQVWRRPDTAEFLVATKGAPEAVARLCRLAGPEIDALRQTVDAMAGDGLRVLGVGVAFHGDGNLPESQTEFAFRFLGLVGLADPLRPGVPEAIGDCRTAGFKASLVSRRINAECQSAYDRKTALCELSRELPR